MAADKTVNIKISADAKNAETALGRLTKAFTGLTGGAGLLRSAVAGLGAGLSAAAFTAFIKNAINAADEMNELAQKTGVAVESLAGLQLAFRQSGLETGNLQTLMARLSKAMAEGNKGFEAMGLSVKKADGSLKSTRDMLGEIADKFASYRDGAEKTALAMQIFGRSGAEIIPVLNGGSKALDEYDRVAKQLGLTLSEETAQAADRFNDTLDLVGQGAQGVARQLMAQLLPTLESLAGNFLKTMTEGDRMKKVADGLTTAFRLLYSAGLLVSEVFSTVGKYIAGSVAAWTSALQGNFKEAWTILKIAGQDIKEGWIDTAKQVEQTWSAAGDSGVAAMTAITKATKNAAPVVADMTAKAKGLSEAFKDAAKSAEQTDNAWAAFSGEWSSTENWEQFRQDFKTKYGETSDIILEETEKVTAKVDKEWMRTAEQIGQSLADALMEGGKSAWEYIKGLFRNLVFKVPLQNLVTGIVGSLGLGGTAMAAENGMGQALGLGGIVSTLKGTFDAITGSFTGLADSIAFTLGNSSNAFLQSAGSFITANSAIVGAMGSIAAGASLGYFGGSMIGGDYRLGGMSANTTAGLGALAGAGLVGGSMAMAAGGIGAMLGTTMGPLGMAIGAAIGGALGGTLNKLFGNKDWKVDNDKFRGTYSMAGASLERYTELKAKGGVFSDTKKRSDIQAFNAEIDAYLDQSLTAIGASTKAYAAAIGLSADAVDGYSKAISINIQNLKPEEIEQAINDSLTGFGESLAADLYPVVDAYKKAGETTQQTLAQLATNLSGVNKVLDVLNLTLYETSLAGADASSALVDLFGSLENFLSSTTAYYQEFYTEEERLQKTTEQLQTAFIALGKALPANKQGFRDIVDSLDLTTTSGQATFRALMALAPAFDLVSDATEDNLLRLLNAQNDLLSEQQKAYIKQLDAARDVALAWVDTAQTITESIRNLLGGSLSTLSPEQKLATSGSSFQTALGMAMAGDLEAAKSLPGLASSYLEAAQAYYASTPDYASIFDNVLAGLGSIESYGAGQIATANGITGLLNSITAPSNDGPQTVAALQEQNKILLEQNRLLQAGFNELIKVNQQGNDIASSTNNTLRLDSTAA